MHYLLTKRVVMLRVGVTIKQIENKHLQNLLIFLLKHSGGHKKIGGKHCPRMPPVTTGLLDSAFANLQWTILWIYSLKLVQLKQNRFVLLQDVSGYITPACTCYS